MKQKGIHANSAEACGLCHIAELQTARAWVVHYLGFMP
jgi:hypothetical protein